MINEPKSISEIQDFRVYLGENSKPAGLIQHLENERQLGSIQEKKKERWNFLDQESLTSKAEPFL